MLVLSKELYNRPVLSLRSGTSIAQAERPLIDPRNLQIVGWWCKPRTGKGPRILLSTEARDIGNKGIIVDDHMDLSEPEDLVRLREVIDIDYTLEGKAVKTERNKLGKVSDFSFNDGFFVQKLYVSSSIVKALGANEWVIDRTQVIEVTDKYILVRDAEIKEESLARQPSFATGTASAGGS